jgi:8-oxo-dGTP diphosphatase
LPDDEGQEGNGGSGRLAMPLLELSWLPDIVLVVEGAAREVAADQRGASDEGGPIRVVAARGSGDDAIAELAASTPGRRIVVTADRELRQRCTAAGAEVAGPGWLLRQVER